MEVSEITRLPNANRAVPKTKKIYINTNGRNAKIEYKRNFVFFFKIEYKIKKDIGPNDVIKKYIGLIKKDQKDPKKIKANER